MKEYKLINRGRTAEVYLYSDDQILKLFRSSFPREGIELEYKIGLIINRTHLGPKLIKKITYQNRVGFVYERVAGKTLLFTLISKPWLIFYYSQLLAELHFQINQQENKQLPKLKERLIQNIGATPLIDNNLKKRIIDYVHLLPNKNNICHGDFHPDNIILSPTGPIAIDWMTAASGDSTADFTRSLVLLKYGQLPKDKKIIEKIITTCLRKIIYLVYKSKYQKLSGITDLDIQKWELPIAAARLRESIPDSEKKILLNLITKNPPPNRKGV